MVEEEGAQYLGNALQTNAVSNFSIHPLHIQYGR